MSVSRETGALARRHGLTGDAGLRLAEIVAALAAEPDPQTTIRDPLDVVARHLADSLEALAIEAVRAARRIADIGSGAGFPGLALAVALPAASVDLVESQRRKCAVATRLAEAGRLDNVRVVCRRAEDWARHDGNERYDVVTARAVAELPVLLEYAAPLLAEGGLFVAWKGMRREDEEARGLSAAAELGLRSEEVLRTKPFDDARDHHLHLYRKVGPTPDRYPRRPGQAAKSPLA